MGAGIKKKKKNPGGEGNLSLFSANSYDVSKAVTKLVVGVMKGGGVKTSTLPQTGQKQKKQEYNWVSNTTSTKRTKKERKPLRKTGTTLGKKEKTTKRGGIRGDVKKRRKLGKRKKKYHKMRGEIMGRGLFFLNTKERGTASPARQPSGTLYHKGEAAQKNPPLAIDPLPPENKSAKQGGEREKREAYQTRYRPMTEQRKTPPNGQKTNPPPNPPKKSKKSGFCSVVG